MQKTGAPGGSADLLPEKDPMMYKASSEQRTWSALGGPRRIQVLALDYHRRPHKRWTGWLLDESAEQIVVYRPPHGMILLHDQTPLISQVPAISVFWPARPYTLAYLLDANARVQGYYVRIILPPICRPGYLEYTDLDLGLLVGPDLAYTVDSADAVAAYPLALRDQAQAALREVQSLLDAEAPLFRPPRQWLDALEVEHDTLHAVAAMLR